MSKPELGICGPHAIASIVGMNVDQVIHTWVDGYQGYAPLWQVRRELSWYGVSCRLQSGRKSKIFSIPNDTDAAIARIQWEGDWGHWAEAQKHTHYVALHRVNGKLMVDCDGWGIFEANTNDYLTDPENGGHITSYLLINK